MTLHVYYLGYFCHGIQYSTKYASMNELGMVSVQYCYQCVTNCMSLCTQQQIPQYCISINEYKLYKTIINHNSSICRIT